MSDGAFVVDDDVRELAVHPVEVTPNMRAEDIHPGSALTEHLVRFAQLGELAGRIRDTYPSFDLHRWLTGAVLSRGDTAGTDSAPGTLLARTDIT
jgi:hypothetical protein